MRIVRAVLPTLVLLAPVAAQAQGAVTLMPHRAVYDLKLDKATEQSGISNISGRMVYEFNGSACEGYTVTFRFVTEINTADATRVTDQQTTTFEDGEGKTFNFATKSYIDRALDRELRGTATREADAVEVKIEKPQPNDIKLPATQFPTQHMLELVNRAEKGDTFYETTLFDGSDEADKVMTTTIVIGKPTKEQAGDAEAGPLKDLADDTYWPVDIAYFDLVGDGGEETPDYRTSFKLHANGLTRDLVMDYGDFSMTGTLVNLDILPASSTPCPDEKAEPKPQPKP
ncbi:cell envelope integrity EipB family protein [Tianweitania sp. BSSL-BM11]|uniref:Cell envelope integrity EipB family protein n=1 Tax=Tianweitania aestuarii TaxID=2814886 RepID=A0ABS5RW18_9HYPH|nr:cell envelope integrity EipB family protein [Tianweitania aestuarii]MBS9720466.1 cell envelope integrity EipB family protein [Tianweitania aestuarii]